MKRMIVDLTDEQFEKIQELNGKMFDSSISEETSSDINFLISYSPELSWTTLSYNGVELGDVEMKIE